jgi:MerR family mercuric resistance operon transcriptional regulator
MMRSEVARRAGCSGETLRHYEAVGLLRPKRRGTGDYRDYEARDVARVVLIRNARSLGLSLKAIGDLLSLADDRALPCDQIDRLATKHLTDVRDKIAALEQIASALERAIRSCSGGPMARCRILDALTQPPAERSVRRRAQN